MTRQSPDIARQAINLTRPGTRNARQVNFSSRQAAREPRLHKADPPPEGTDCDRMKDDGQTARLRRRHAVAKVSMAKPAANPKEAGSGIVERATISVADKARL